MIPVHHYLRRNDPDATALVGARKITYGQLRATARALAAHLQAKGARRGDRVGICMEKSPRAIGALLGTLEAGLVYVPIDPSQPPARAAAILRDAQPVALFTDPPRHAELATLGLPGSLSCVISGDEAFDVAAATAPSVPAPGAHEPRPDDLAILLYTSGSTGVPKGVKISYENLHSFIGWARAEMDLRPTDVFSSHAGLHFDLSTFDLFAAQAAGAAVWLIPESDTRDPHVLARGIRQHHVTVWYSVPSILSLLLAAEALDADTARSLRYVLFAGEVFPIKALRELRARLPAARLYNLYGPTETNVCTWYEVRDLDPARASPVPIGRALPGVEAWLEGDAGERLPEASPDAMGELIIRGPCVTPGYWSRPGDAAAADHARRVHRTGDLASYEPGGELVYRGRKDRMLKVNGFRVELGEIEAALLQHPKLAEAAVVAVPSGDGVRLVACCVAAAGERVPGLIELKAHAARLVPRYMIPHGVLAMDALPKNANGKTNLLVLAEHAAAARA